MKKVVIGCLLLMINSAFSQELDRKYQRKSITSLGGVILAPGVKAPVDVVESRLRSMINLPRFDQNNISLKSISDFEENVNKTNFRPSQISRVLEKTVLNELVGFLEEVAIKRAEENLTDEQLATAAVDKMKSSGVTGEDFLKVLNSAYLYLPVITSYSEMTGLKEIVTISDLIDGFVGKESKNDKKKKRRRKRKKKLITEVKIRGYLLWYRVAISKSGKAKIVRISELTEIQTGSAEAETKENYDIKNRLVKGKVFARLIAANTWAKNIVNVLKSHEDFVLSAEILEVSEPSVFAMLGEKEGVGLDDGYNLVEYAEDENGDIHLSEVGFYRAKSIEGKKNSEFWGYIVGEPERGMLLQERPRLPFDFVLGVNTARTELSSKNIPLTYADYLSSSSEENVFRSGEFLYGLGLNLGLNFNLAKLLYLSQFFLTVEASGSIFFAEKANVSALAGGGYVGLMKKFWIGFFNINLATEFGVDYLLINGGGSESDAFESYGTAYPLFRGSLGLEFMLSPDVLMCVKGGWKFAFSSFEEKLSYKNQSEAIDLAGTGNSVSVNTGGLFVNLNFSFALNALPFDPFPAISASEIEY